MKKRFAAALVCFCALAQEPKPATPIIRVSVNLVQIDAIVTDSKGRHVPGLRAEDFIVMEDGKPQKITSFSYIDNTPAPVPATAPLSVTTNAPVVKPRRDQIHRTLVIVLDDLHTDSAHIATLLPVAKKFVDEQVAPGDLVSVMSTRDSMGIYEQFTTDKRQLQADLDHLTHRAGVSFESIVQNSYTPDDTYFMELYHQMAMASLSRAIDGLREMPGRKAIVFFSDGISFPPSSGPAIGMVDVMADSSARMMGRTKKTVDLANRSGVAFYTIDAGGLQTTQFTAATNTRGSGGNQAALSALYSQKQNDAQAAHELSTYMAGETGGAYFTGTNNLSQLLGKAMDDMTGYYLLGYQPARDDFELKRGQTRQHSIQVKVSRSGLSVRSRRGFSGTLDAEVPAAGTVNDELRRALVSPFDAGDIHLHLTPVYASASAHAILGVEGRNLHFLSDGKGNQKAELDTMTNSYDGDGRQMSSVSQRFTLEVPDARVKQLQETGFTWQVDVAIPKPGAYQIRSSVRDSASKNSGSATAFIVMPDFAKPRISLSSLLLTDAGFSNQSTAFRRFTAGSPIIYKCASNVKAVEYEIQLFHEGKSVYSSGPINAKDSTLTGSLKIPVGLAEGDYDVELRAKDPGSPRAVAQWSNFTLTKTP